MEKFSDRLKKMRKERGLNQQQLSVAIGISRSAIANYEQGTRKPKTDERWKCIADFFETSVDYLMSGKEHKVNKKEVYDSDSKHVVFPVIGEVAAGYDQIPIAEWDGETLPIHIDNLKGRPKSDFFVLEVKGDSMFPEFQDGDKVLIQKQETLEYSGQVGVMLYDGEYTTLKKVEFKHGEDWLNLVPINPNYPRERIEGADLERCRVLGFPVLLIREYE